MKKIGHLIIIIAILLSILETAYFGCNSLPITNM